MTGLAKNTQQVVKRIEDAQAELEVLQAILLLEYHDNNHLAFGTNPKKLNENQRKLVRDAMQSLKEGLSLLA